MRASFRRRIVVTLGAVAFTAGVLTSWRVLRAAPGGNTSAGVAFSGVLRDTSGNPMGAPTTVTFIFKRGVSECSSPALNIDPDDSTGAFQVDIPLTTCPEFFDGSDVTVDVMIAQTPVAMGSPIRSVPYAKYADAVGSPDCPPTYTYAGQATLPGTIRCLRGSDEVVKVGRGAASYWIDRYEASLWSAPDGSGTQYTTNAAYQAAGFPRNGQWTVKPLYAASRAGVPPSAGMTWFQAAEACRASGKRLPTNEEWQAAARGTVDPGENNGLGNAKCNTFQGNAARNTGLGGECESGWGAQDMIGNLMEIVAEWQASPREFGGTDVSATWSAEYNGDYSLNMSSVAYNPSGEAREPAALSRGGGWAGGTTSGIFFYNLRDSVTSYNAGIGFRCVIPR